MTARRFALSTTLFAALTCAAPSFADKTGANADPGTPGADSAVAQLTMAQQLYAYGVEADDPLAMLTAARITGAISTEDVAREAKTEKIADLDITEEGEGVDAPVDAAMMLAAAKDAAGEDPAFLALIEDAEAEGSRGRIGGPSKTLSRLRAGHTDVFEVPFYGGRLAELAILGDGDADLDLVVTDENGNTICLDRSFSDKLYCSFTPRWDGYFYVGVKNMGRIRNSYYILTN